MVTSFSAINDADRTTEVNMVQKKRVMYLKSLFEILIGIFHLLYFNGLFRSGFDFDSKIQRYLFFVTYHLFYTLFHFFQIIHEYVVVIFSMTGCANSYYGELQRLGGGITLYYIRDFVFFDWLNSLKI